MAWWPFGRKKRRARADEHAATATAAAATRAPAASLASEKPDDLRERDDWAYRPTAPLARAPDDYSARSRPPPKLPTPTRGRPAGYPSIEDLTALPQPPQPPPPQTPTRRRYESPHLMPVPETRPPTSFTTPDKDADALRRKSTRRYEDKLRGEQLRSVTAPIPIPGGGRASGNSLFRRDTRRRSREPPLSASYPGRPAAASARSSLVAVSVPDGLTSPEAASFFRRRDSFRESFRDSVRDGFRDSLRDSQHRDSTNLYDFGSLGLLSPRPRLRYSMPQGGYSAGALASGLPGVPGVPGVPAAKDPQPTPRRDRERDPTRDRGLTSAGGNTTRSRTVDDAVDNMDARALRELMDRDARRRSRKDRRDADRAARRLERYARAAEAAEAAERTAAWQPAGQAEANGEADGHAADLAAPQPEGQHQPATAPSASGLVKAYPAAREPARNGHSQPPVATPAATTTHDDALFRMEEDDEQQRPQQRPQPQPGRTFSYKGAYPSPPASPPALPAAAGHVRHQSSTSQITDPARTLARTSTNGPSLSEVASTGQSTGRQTSIPDARYSDFDGDRDADPASGSSQARRSAFAALFRRSVRGRRKSGAATGDARRANTGSSPTSATVAGRSYQAEPAFANTSRENIAATRQAEPPLPERTYRRVSTGLSGAGGGAPIVRTRSKFREELPEYRQRDEPGPAREAPAPREQLPDLPQTPQAQYQPTPFFTPPLDSAGKSSLDNYGFTPGQDSSPSAALLSQSLASVASVGSEASWLSGGKPASTRKRASGQLSLSTARSSYARAPEAVVEAEQPRAASPDADPPNTLRQGAVSRKPTVVHRDERAQSAQGLLAEVGDAQQAEAAVADGSDDPDTEASLASATASATTSTAGSPPLPSAEIQQARSGYGLGHARSVSAGSARLLDVGVSPTSPTFGKRRLP